MFFCVILFHILHGICVAVVVAAAAGPLRMARQFQGKQERCAFAALFFRLHVDIVLVVATDEKRKKEEKHTHRE